MATTDAQQGRRPRDLGPFLAAPSPAANLPPGRSPTTSPPG